MARQRQREREYKAFPALIMKADEEQGIVDAFVSIMGNIDLMDDIIHMGAFKKTITERGLKIQVLDNHNNWSGLDAIAKIMQIKEVGRDDLPDSVVQEFPDATGGLFVRIKFIMDDDLSVGIFKRIRDGVLTQYSIGFEIIQFDISAHDTPDGEMQVRNIREIKLWEVSPVIFAANPATTTVDAKDNGSEPEVPAIHTTFDNALMTNLRISEAKSMCSTCKVFGRVTEHTGYCKAFDTATLSKWLCDDFEIKELDEPDGYVLMDDFKLRAHGFINELVTDYAELGYWFEADIKHLTALFNEIIESMALLFPDDLMSRTIEQPDGERDIEQESEQPEKQAMRRKLMQARLQEMQS